MLRDVSQFHRVRESDGRTLYPTSSDSAAKVGAEESRQGEGRPTSAKSPPFNRSNQVIGARLVVGWRSRAIDPDREFNSREALGDTVSWSSSRRLHRAWRCCVFGEPWAERLERQGDVVHGKFKVPSGYVTALVEAFCVAEGRGRGEKG